jgi:hypothetical protein
VRPRVVVRWTDPLSSRREPNSRGRSSGSHILDQWLGRNYRLLERDGFYDVLVLGNTRGNPRRAPVSAG